MRQIHLYSDYGDMKKNPEKHLNFSEIKKIFYPQVSTKILE